MNRIKPLIPILSVYLFGCAAKSDLNKGRYVHFTECTWQDSISVPCEMDRPEIETVISLVPVDSAYKIIDLDGGGNKDMLNQCRSENVNRGCDTIRVRTMVVDTSKSVHGNSYYFHYRDGQWILYENDFWVR